MKKIYQRTAYTGSDSDFTDLGFVIPTLTEWDDKVSSSVLSNYAALAADNVFTATNTFNANTTYAFNTRTYLGNTTNSYIFSSSNPSIKLTNNSSTTRYTLLSVGSFVVHYSNTDITTYSNSIKHNNNGTLYTYNFPQYDGTLAVVSASDSSSITINGTQIPLSSGGGNTYNHYITLHANNDNGPDEGCDVVFNVITSDNTAITTDTALLNAIKTGVIVVKSASNYYYNSSFEKQTQTITPQNLKIAIGPWSSEPYDFDCIKLTLLDGSLFNVGSTTSTTLNIGSSVLSGTTDYNNVTISDTVQQTVVLPRQYQHNVYISGSSMGSNGFDAGFQFYSYDETSVGDYTKLPNGLWMPLTQGDTMMGETVYRGSIQIDKSRDLLYYDAYTTGGAGHISGSTSLSGIFTGPGASYDFDDEIY